MPTYNKYDILTLKSRMVRRWAMPFAYVLVGWPIYGAMFNVKVGQGVILIEIRVDVVRHLMHPTGSCDCGSVINDLRSALMIGSMPPVRIF